MGSPRVLKRLLLILIVVCGITVLAAVYLIVKPQRHAARVIQVLEQVQIDHTRIEDIAPALRRAGAVAGVKSGKCEVDLNGPRDPKTSRSPASNGGSPLPAELERVCGYNLDVDNKFLHKLGLAPATTISVNIDASDGIVDQILFFLYIGEWAHIGTLHFIQIVPGRATTCGQDTCFERYYSKGSPRIDIQVSADAPSAERNRLLNFNTRCFSKIGGCKDLRELLPIAENN